MAARSDFVPEPSASSLTYGRGGGCFLSRVKAIALGVAVVAAVILAAAFGRYVWAPAPPPAIPGYDAGGGGGGAAGSADPHHSKFRLPRDVRPVRYRLHLWPVLDVAPPNRSNFTFEGRIALTTEVVAEGGARRIAVHVARTLTVHDEDVVLARWSTEAEALVDSWDGFPDRRPSTRTPTSGPATTIPIKVERTPSQDLLELVPEETLEKDEWYMVLIRFNGTLGDSLTGFYRSSYPDKATKAKRWLAATHMQPMFAREAFPCMDEPALRAPFRVSLAARKGTTPIANAPLKTTVSIADAPDWQWYHFKDSVPMPTYLVAFAVTDFGYIKPTRYRLRRSSVTKKWTLEDITSAFVGLPKPKPEPQDEIEVRLWARPSLLERGRYSVELVPRLLAYYGEFFGVDYCLTKMDILAIPDFDAGAMENWGLIIFRETNLLVDKTVDGVSAVELAAVTMAHELAHQWLGNLVTASWWDELWLNEGFSTFVQFAAMDSLEPTWKTQERFQTNVMQPTLDADSSKATRAIAAQMPTKDDVNQAFDAITYDKGACLLRMLYHSLGDDAFKRGVRQYIRTWQHNSTTESRLWEPLTEAVAATPAEDDLHVRLPRNATVGQVMASWTKAKGYPVVNVTLNRAAGTVSFVQEQLLDRAWERNCSRPYSSEELWHVPLSMATKAEAAANASILADRRPRAWLVNRTLELRMHSPPGPHDWLLVNLQQTGYFRVNYDLENWRLLAEQLRADHSALPAPVRSQLLADAFALAFAGQLAYPVALNLTRYLPLREMDPKPWTSALSALGVIRSQLADQPELVVFERYMQRLLKPVWDHVAPDDPGAVASPSPPPSAEATLEELQYRASVVSWACGVHLFDCEDWATRVVHRWRVQSDAINTIPVLLRDTAYCSAVATGSTDVWEFMWQQFQAHSLGRDEESIDHQETILKSLACTSDPARVASLLARAVKETDIRPQDVGTLWMSAASKPVSSLVAFRYLRDHWPAIQKRHGTSSIISESVVSAAAGSLSSQSDLRDLQAFRAEHDATLGPSSRSLDIGEEGLRTALEWRAVHLPVVLRWMEDALRDPRAFS